MGLDISTLAPTALSDSAALYDDGATLVSSAFARLVFQTEATTLRLDTYSDMKSAYSAISKYGVWVDGSYFGSFNPAANGASSFYLGLDSGLKTIEFVAGAQTVTGGPLLGNYLVSVTANKPMTQLELEPADLLIYGDSIAVGDGCGTSVQIAAWPLLVRGAYDGEVALEAWGSRSLYDDANSPSLRAAFVAKIAARNPTRFWSAIGTNDYGLNKWSAASFGTALAAFLDDLHTAMPSLLIDVMTPTVRTSEAANGSGSALGDYRTQIATVCGARGWTNLVDGAGFITTGDLVDSVHPNVTGHDKIADAVLLELAA